MYCANHASGCPAGHFQQEAVYNTCNGTLCSLLCHSWNNRYNPYPETLPFYGFCFSHKPVVPLRLPQKHNQESESLCNWILSLIPPPVS